MKKEQGQSLVEFALVFPILIVMLLMVHDISQFVGVKSNLQNLTGELSKMVSLYNERNDGGGIQHSPYFGDFDSAVEYVIGKDNTLNHENLTYNISFGNKITRPFERYAQYWDTDYQMYRFVPVQNENYVQYVTVTLDYKPEKGNFLSGHFLGEDFKISRSYTGLIYLGSDGHDD